MIDAHLVIGVSVLLLSLVAGVWGGAAWLRQRPTTGFWYVLRAMQVAVAVQVMFGTLLLFLGHQSADKLHYVYGALPLLVSLLGEGARAGAATHELEDVDFEALEPERQRLVALAILRRETGIMALSAIVIFFLALRAAGTSAEF